MIEAPSAPLPPAGTADGAAGRDVLIPPVPPAEPLESAAAGASSREPTGSGADAATLPRDLSPWGMFMAADVVVKAVMIGLAFASLVTWTVWLAKSARDPAAGPAAAPVGPVVLGAHDLETAERALAGRRGPVR